MLWIMYTILTTHWPIKDARDKVSTSNKDDNKYNAETKPATSAETTIAKNTVTENGLGSPSNNTASSSKVVQQESVHTTTGILQG